MAWVILVVALIVGLGGGWAAYTSARRWRSAEQRRIARATIANARVLDVSPGDTPRTRDVVPVRLRLLIESTTGRDDREVSIGWEVPTTRMPDLAVGERIQVRVDRFDADRVYPLMAGAALTPLTD